ncbi:MAG: hypothetical protein WBP26_05640 [Candidatus Saccharimonadales bacterium]
MIVSFVSVTANPGVAAAACDRENVAQCSTGDSCQANGGVWRESINFCVTTSGANAGQCKNNNGIWVPLPSFVGVDAGGICLPRTDCSTTTLDNCADMTACEGAGGLWQNATSSAFHCVPSNQVNCESDDGVWLNNTCHENGSDVTGEDKQNNDSGSQCKNTNKGLTGIFRIPTWYKYLEVDDECNIVNFSLLGESGKPSGLLLIVLAIIDIGLRIAGLVAVAFVVVGGIKFVTSQGDPEDVKNARNTVLNALIGLVIAILATPLVAFIGAQLGK